MKRVLVLMLIALMSSAATGGPAQENAEDPTAYDARLTFARLRYSGSADSNFGMRGGGFNGEGQPPWAHDYPRAERNLMHILAEVTTADPFVDPPMSQEDRAPSTCNFLPGERHQQESSRPTVA